MKTTTTTSKTLRTLSALLATAENDLRVWYREGIPTEQKKAEIKALEERIAKLS